MGPSLLFNMKKIICIFYFVTSISNSYANSLYYKLEEGDQLGQILLSLGNKRIWNKTGKLHIWKKNFQIWKPRKLIPGEIVTIDSSFIKFKKNVTIDDNQVFFIKKITNLNEYDDLFNQENNEEIAKENEEETKEEIKNEIGLSNNSEKIPELILPVSNITEKSSITILPAIGFATSKTSEKDDNISTTTSTGLQPILQMKLIYQIQKYGIFLADFKFKKIINDKFDFKNNIDSSLEYIFNWNIVSHLKFSLTHSFANYSFVGKHSDNEIGYEFNSKFIGAGLIFLGDNFWLESYFEKMYTGKTVSSEIVHDNLDGFRISTELNYPIYKGLRFLPALYYYDITGSNYRIRTFDAKIAFGREFTF